MWTLFISSLVAAAAAVSSNVVHERRFAAGYAWKTSALDSEAVLPVRIALAQRNLDKGYDHVMDVSDPESENYGKHWTLEEVDAEFAPADESVDLVTEWLEKSGIAARRTSNKGWIAFDAPVHQIEKLLNAEYQEYKTNDGTVRIGCDEYSLPQYLTPHIDYITPGVKFSSLVPTSKIVKDDSNHKRFDMTSQGPSTGPYSPPPGYMGVSPDVQNCGVNITPPCYRALYDLPAPSNFDFNIPAGEIGVFQSGSVYSQEDLNEYFAKIAPYVPNGTAPYLYSINNATAPLPKSNLSGESNLDFSTIYSLLGGVNVSLYQTQAPQNSTLDLEISFLDPFLDAINGSYCSQNETDAGFQCGVYPLSKVLSASYVFPELVLLPKASQVRACNEFMKLSLQGHTILFASGDYGVASNPVLGEILFDVTNGCIPQHMQTSDNNSSSSLGKIMQPGFPANCPYVLSVGGTQLTANQTVNDPESVMDAPGIGLDKTGGGSTFSSGGGFTNYFPRPSYQDDVVQKYLDTFVPDYPYYESNFVDVLNDSNNIGSNGGIYNRNGRAIPDVSANGAHALIVNAGEVEQVYGTSVATPVWAAIITMLNAERAAAGRPSVGFVHPILYQNPQAFNDITVGTNPGCETNGFPAVKGWDPSTGLGTPNYTKLSGIFGRAGSYPSKK